MFHHLVALFQKPDDDGLSQRQREALLDLFVWVMYLDHRLELSEEGKIEQLGQAFTWEGGESIENYTLRAVGRMIAHLGSLEAQERFIQQTADILNTPALRQRAFEACQKIVRADYQVTSEEAQSLNMIQRVFDLPRR